MIGDSCWFVLELYTEVSMLCIHIILRPAINMAGGGTSWLHVHKSKLYNGESVGQFGPILTRPVRRTGQRSQPVLSKLPAILTGWTGPRY